MTQLPLGHKLPLPNIKRLIIFSRGQLEESQNHQRIRSSFLFEVSFILSI